MMCFLMSILALVFAIGAAVLVYFTATTSTKVTMDVLADQTDDKALAVIQKWRAKR